VVIGIVRWDVDGDNCNTRKTLQLQNDAFMARACYLDNLPLEVVLQ